MYRKFGMPQTSRKKLTVLGLDPGIDRLGWGVVCGSTFKDFAYVSSGLISTTRTEQVHFRLKEIYDDLHVILEKFKPDIVYAEQLFFSKNVTTAMTISEVRGVIKLCVQLKEVPYFEINPRSLKKRMTGVGNAKKNQIRFVLQHIFGFTELPKPDDVADAIAISYVGLLEQLGQMYYTVSNPNKKD